MGSQGFAKHGCPLGAKYCEDEFDKLLMNFKQELPLPPVKSQSSQRKHLLNSAQTLSRAQAGNLAARGLSKK